MDEKQAQGKVTGPSLWVAGSIALLLVVGILFTWWTAMRADREMRADLMQQARLAAQAVSLERVQALAGSEAELTSPDYLRLKKQLDGIRTTNPQCRGLYLMGRHPDGTVFFLVDTQNDATENSPSALPGELYPDASDELKALFATGVPFVEGPLPDEWGVWVSALVPLTDPDTDAVIAVVGMDIDAGDWNLKVAERAALPVGLMLLLLIGGVTALAITRRVSASPKPVLRRLLLPHAVLVVLFRRSARGRFSGSSISSKLPRPSRAMMPKSRGTCAQSWSSRPLAWPPPFSPSPQMSECSKPCARATPLVC